MKQIFLLRGGIAKENFRDFDEYLEKLEVDINEECNIKWSDKLQKDLGNDFKVITIERILEDFADYETRKKIFEKYRKFCEDGCILIGHSLGGSFLLKYLNENDFESLHFSKIILIAPAVNDSEEEVMGRFAFDEDLEKLQKIQDKIHIFGSKDDFCVDFKDIEILKENLPNANFYVFEDKGHFLQEDFPELLATIKK